jgi:hypothetical protein
MQERLGTRLGRSITSNITIRCGKIVNHETNGSRKFLRSAERKKERKRTKREEKENRVKKRKDREKKEREESS